MPAVRIPAARLTGGRCPECGLTLTDANRLRERRRVAEPILWCAAAAFVVICYFGYADQLPRQTSVGTWFSIRSTFAYGLWRHWHAAEFRPPDDNRRGPACNDPRLDDAGHGDTHFLEQRAVIVEIDFATGEILRTIRDEPGERWLGSIAVSADGGSLFVDWQREVEQLDAVTGEAQSRFPYSGRVLSGSVAVSADGRSVFAAGFSFECVRWDICSGLETAPVPWPDWPPLRRAYRDDHDDHQWAFRPALSFGRLDFFSGVSVGFVRDFQASRWISLFSTPGEHSGLAIDRQQLMAFRHATIFVYELKRLLADATWIDGSIFALPRR